MMTAEIGYTAVRRLVHHQAHKFQRRFGGDLDDVIGDAHVLFLRGHAVAHKRPTYAYATHIRLWVWYGLFDAMRKAAQRKAKASFTPLERDGQVMRMIAPREFSMGAFECDHTADAAYAARLALYPPADLAEAFKAKGGEPRNMRSCIRAYLREHGWSPERIGAAFGELAETC